MSCYNEKIQRDVILEMHGNASISDLKTYIKNNKYEAKISSSYDSYYNTVLNELLTKRIIERRNFIEELEENIIPDLEYSGDDEYIDEMAKTLRKCISFMS